MAGGGDFDGRSRAPHVERPRTRLDPLVVACFCLSPRARKTIPIGPRQGTSNRPTRPPTKAMRTIGSASPSDSSYRQRVCQSKACREGRWSHPVPRCRPKVGPPVRSDSRLAFLTRRAADRPVRVIDRDSADTSLQEINLRYNFQLGKGRVTKIGRTDTGDRMSFAPRNLAPAGAEG